jgi:two-component system response regulator QseB
MRILLVEDDEQLGDAVRKGLTLHGHHVDWVKDGLAAENIIRQDKFDLIVLDINLPGQSGLEVLRLSRREGIRTPVLVLTAHDTNEAIVGGLDTGADDYLIKPFDLDVLSARVRALHRRATGRAEPNLVFENIELFPASHVVKVDGVVLPLPRREYAILEKLMENQGRVISREHLSNLLYGFGEDVDSNALEVHIHNLRKKFGQNTIITIRGVGYMLGHSQISSPSSSPIERG